MAQSHSPVVAGKVLLAGLHPCAQQSGQAISLHLAVCIAPVPCLQDKVEVPDSKYSKQKLLLGTHTSEEEQNHLLLAEVHLPTEDSELSSAQYDEESAEIGGYGASPGSLLSAS